MNFKLWLETQNVEMPFSDLIISRNSLFGAFRDVSIGRISKTFGPLQVWQTEDGKYQLTDGYHRAFVSLLLGQKITPVKVIGSGYSDYHAVARFGDRFEYSPNLPYQGLENLADDEILEDIKKRLFPVLRP